jgi:hypothetical protein
MWFFILCISVSAFTQIKSNCPHFSRINSDINFSNYIEKELLKNKETRIVIYYSKLTIDQTYPNNQDDLYLVIYDFQNKYVLHAEFSGFISSAEVFGFLSNKDGCLYSINYQTNPGSATNGEEYNNRLLIYPKDGVEKILWFIDNSTGYMNTDNSKYQNITINKQAYFVFSFDSSGEDYSSRGIIAYEYKYKKNAFYLKEIASFSISNSHYENSMVMINDNKAILRRFPKVQAELITILNSYDEIKIMNDNYVFDFFDNNFGFWINIKKGDYTGWVWSKYISQKKLTNN